MSKRDLQGLYQINTVLIQSKFIELVQYQKPNILLFEILSVTFYHSSIAFNESSIKKILNRSIKESNRLGYKIGSKSFLFLPQRILIRKLWPLFWVSLHQLYFVEYRNTKEDKVTKTNQKRWIWVSSGLSKVYGRWKYVNICLLN